MKHYLVIFYDDDNRVIRVETFTEKEESQKRIKSYKDKCNAMLHEIEIGDQK
jgi:hypothetical protein